MNFPVALSGKVRVANGETAAASPEATAKAVVEKLAAFGTEGLERDGAYVAFRRLIGRNRLTGAGEVDVARDDAGIVLSYRVSMIRLLMGSLIMIAFLYFVPLILFGLRFRWAWPEVTAHARQYLGWHLFWGWLWLFGGPCVILHFRLRSLLRGSLS